MKDGLVDRLPIALVLANAIVWLLVLFISPAVPHEDILRKDLQRLSHHHEWNSGEPLWLAGRLISQPTTPWGSVAGLAYTLLSLPGLTIGELLSRGALAVLIRPSFIPDDLTLSWIAAACLFTGTTLQWWACGALTRAAVRYRRGRKHVRGEHDAG